MEHRFGQELSYTRKTLTHCLNTKKNCPTGGHGVLDGIYSGDNSGRREIPVHLLAKERQKIYRHTKEGKEVNKQEQRAPICISTKNA